MSRDTRGTRTEEHSTAAAVAGSKHPALSDSTTTDTPSRSKIERFAAGLLENDLRIGWTFGKGKDAGNPRVDPKLPTELGALSGYIAAKLRTRNPILQSRANGLFEIDGDTPELRDAARRIGGPTFEIVSGGGGTNLVYRAPDGVELAGLWVENTTGRIVAKSDGYLVAPLALHPDTGVLYEWNGLPVAELTAAQYAELVALASDAPESSSNGSLRELASGSKPEPSSRHDADYLEACRLWRDYPDTEDGFAGVLEDVLRFSATHPDGARSKSDIRKDVRRARNYMRGEGSIGADAESSNGSPSPNGSRSFELVTLDKIEERPIRFFERPLWLAESFSLFVARSGAGKGVTLADLAARTTRGELGARRNVVWFASEDSAATDLRPRLSVAGADLGHVHVVSPGSGWLRLPEDIELVRTCVREIGDVALVIIDPVASYLGKQGQTTTDEVHVRNALDPLNALADELGVCVVGVRHITEKGRDGDLSSLILGTSAWVQVPRAVVGIVKDNEDPDVRHIGVSAGNRVREGDVLSLRIVGVDRSDKGHETEIPRVQWLGESAKSLDDLLRGSSARSKSGIAREAILEELRAAPDHELPSDELDARVVERTGVSAKTARNVRSGLREAGLVGARKDGFGGTWFAYLTAEGMIPT